MKKKLLFFLCLAALHACSACTGAPSGKLDKSLIKPVSGYNTELKPPSVGQGQAEGVDPTKGAPPVASGPSVEVSTGGGATSGTVGTKGNGAAGNATDIASMEELIFNLVNEHRKSIGRNTLQSSEIAATAAREHSQNITDKKVPFSHDGFGQRIKKIVGIEGRLLNNGENVVSAARGVAGAKDAVARWLLSPGHKANIEGDFTHSGVGGAGSGYIYNYTQLFIKK